MSESNMQNLLRNNRTKNLVKLFQEMMNRYGDHLKLFGGSSIIMNLAEQFPSPIEFRPTKDLDFYLYQGLQTREEVISGLKNALKKIDGYTIEVRDMRSGNLKVIFTSEDTDEKIHADLQFVSGLKYENDDIASLDETLQKKLLLNLEVLDRRFKDIVDVMTILKFDYPNGITKGKLLTFFDDDIARLETYLSVENLETQIVQAKKFKPQILNTDSVVEYANSFYELISGIASDDVMDYDLFIHGTWREGDRE